MKSSSLLSLVPFLALMLVSANLSLAGEPEPFVISCDKVESVMVELAFDIESFERRVVGCQVQLTQEAGVELDAHCAKWFGDMFPIFSEGKVITMYDSTTRSTPPQLFFTEETWEAAKTKLMAICSEKIPEIPQRVLDHRPDNQ
ncbi:hypothetical protein [Pseudodesulfovibrio piezophilus]|uniref:hypothetical protein n=1 Tax=Pseudodesulfovibrio piezophilus TaxID=879567 RepID=UPI0005A102F3|nr:hypothetical protein [Pseudodesulfovibrio piezophilus]